MKGIRLCAECLHYDQNKHRCRRGAQEEANPMDPFYDDCPLPDVGEITTGEWILHRGGDGTCAKCKTRQKAVWDDDRIMNYCGCCGAKMKGVKS